MLLFRYPEKRSPVIVPEFLHEERDAAFETVRCPLCDWRPTPADAWACRRDGPPEPPFEWCGNVWHTFSTRGRCPGCQHQWSWTSCLRCGGWSPHEDWYSEE